MRISIKSRNFEKICEYLVIELVEMYKLYNKYVVLLRFSRVFRKYRKFLSKSYHVYWEEMRISIKPSNFEIICDCLVTEHVEVYKPYNKYVELLRFVKGFRKCS